MSDMVQVIYVGKHLGGTLPLWSTNSMADSLERDGVSQHVMIVHHGIPSFVVQALSCLVFSIPSVLTTQHRIIVFDVCIKVERKEW